MTTCLVLQGLAKRVPSSYELIAQRKGFNRYMTSRLRELVTLHKSGLEAREKAAGCILQVTHFQKVQFAYLSVRHAERTKHEHHWLMINFFAGCA